MLALGARIIARIQTSLLLVADASRVEVATMPCEPLATTVVMLLTAIGLRAAEAGRTIRGIGALAATTLGRSAGGAAAGA